MSSVPRSVQVACAQHLYARAHLAAGKARIGVEAFAAALLNMTGILAANAGFDAQECVIALRKAHAEGVPAGLDLTTGEPMDCDLAGVFDTYIVKRQIMNSAPVMAAQLLLVDEVIRAGINMRKRG